MHERLWERVGQSVAGRARPGDEGVSPVVGMILVLAISIVGISAILYWGLPAIDEMKANVEFRSVQSQFEELDSTIKELVAGTTEKTAKRWQPSLQRGELTVYNNTEPWLFAVDTYVTSASDHDFGWGNLSDGDANFAIYSATDESNIKVEGYIVTGTSSATALNISLWGVTPTTPYPQQMTKTQLATWTAGSWQYFNVYESNSLRRLENATFKFNIYSDDNLLAQAWYVATGRIDFSLDAGLGNKDIVSNNGAVFAGTNEIFTIVNTPPIPPPSNSSGTARMFARFITMGGDASFAGTDTFDVLISLYATATLASYDCAKADHTDCVRAIKYYNFGSYREPWYTALTNTGRDYDFERIDPPATIPLQPVQTIKYLRDREQWMGFTLLQSSLKLVNG